MLCLSASRSLKERDPKTRNSRKKSQILAEEGMEACVLRVQLRTTLGWGGQGRESPGLSNTPPGQAEGVSHR